MAVVTLAADAWTSIPLPAGGPAIIESRKFDVWVSTDGTQPGDPTEAVQLTAGGSIVVREGLTVLGRPMRENQVVDVQVNPI